MSSPFDRPGPKSDDELRHAEHLGRCWQWAYSPVRKDSLVAQSVRVLIEEMKRLADVLPRVAELEEELDTLRAHNAAYAKKLAALRGGAAS